MIYIPVRLKCKKANKHVWLWTVLNILPSYIKGDFLYETLCKEVEHNRILYFSERNIPLFLFFSNLAELTYTLHQYKHKIHKRDGGRALYFWSPVTVSMCKLKLVFAIKGKFQLAQKFRQNKHFKNELLCRLVLWSRPLYRYRGYVLSGSVRVHAQNQKNKLVVGIYVRQKNERKKSLTRHLVIVEKSSLIKFKKRFFEGRIK